jgi:MEDS: MEthanogen/methylotroph, DcmR Sensory domain
LASRDFTHSKDEQSLDYLDSRKFVAPLLPQNIANRHEVAFYREDAAFVDGFAHHAEAALKVGNPVILITTASHGREILRRLRAHAVDVDAALRSGSLIQGDALDALSEFMANDLPDSGRCAKLVGDLVTRASKAAKEDRSRVAICEECAPTLLAEGEVEAAIRLEHLWDEITRKYHADTLCGYLWSAFPQRDSSSIFPRICAEHSGRGFTGTRLLGQVRKLNRSAFC